MEAAYAPQNLIDLFSRVNHIGLDEKAGSVPIPSALALKHGGGMDLYALACSPHAAMRLLIDRLCGDTNDDEVEQLVYGFDRFAHEHQGLGAKDWLSVHFWDGERWWLGAIPYWPEDGGWGEVTWELGPLRPMVKREMEECFRINARGRNHPALVVPLNLGEGEPSLSPLLTAEERETT